MIVKGEADANAIQEKAEGQILKAVTSAPCLNVRAAGALPQKVTE